MSKGLGLGVYEATLKDTIHTDMLIKVHTDVMDFKLFIL